MAYVSLYRKYRSQTFDDVVGQDHVVRTIRNAIKAGRIGQGYLFCGSRGTGKTTVARLIAKALNCENGPTPDPCGKCEACTAITGGNAVDVIEMDAASNRGADDVDLLREGVKYPPMQLRYKVYIIDEAHQLSPQAKDAFLKTLEEPPPHAVFILATTESHKIPLTIRSRCQQFDFRRGTVSEIVSRLKHVIAGENAAIDDEAVELIARGANGSYRDSLSLLEQVIAYSDDRISAKEVYTVLGMVDEEVLLELGEVLASTDTAAAFSLADRLLREGRDVRELLKSLANHFRDLLALKVGADQLHAGDERWREQSTKYSQDRLIHIIDIFSAAEKDLKWNEQHRLGLEMALLRAMIRPKEAAAPVAAAVIAAPVRTVQPTAPAEVALTPAPTPAEPKQPAPQGAAAPPQEEPATPEPSPVAPVSPVVEEPAVQESVPSEGKEVTLKELQREWPKVLMQLQSMKNGSVAAAIRSARLVSLSENVLTLGFGGNVSGFHLQRVITDGPKISAALEAVLNVRLRIAAIKLEDEAGADAGQKQPAKPAEPVQHPLTNDVLTMFSGKLVDDDNDPWEG